MSGLKVIVLLALAVALPTVVLADGNTGMISGVVRYYETGQPIPGASVVWASSQGGLGRTKADRNGRFFFLVVSPGATHISAAAPGYSAGCTVATVSANENTSVVVNLFFVKADFIQCSHPYLTTRTGADVYDIF